MTASDPQHPTPPSTTKEPGNALGAVGLIATLLGGAALVYDVPPDTLAWPTWIAWPLAVGGIAMLLAGLAREWNGPARTSALVPGLAALALGAVVVGFAVYPIFAGPRTDRLAIELPAAAGSEGSSAGPIDLVVYTPRHAEATSCALLTGIQPGLGRFTARELASRGVATAVATTSGLDDLPSARVGVLTELTRRSSADRCTLVAYDGTPGSAELLAAAADFDRAVAVSFQAASRVSAPRNAVPTLYLFGGMEPSGHEHARALHSQLGAPGRDGLPESVVRIFLGADADLMVPRDRPWLQPGRLPAGYVDMVALWAERGMTEG